MVHVNKCTCMSYMYMYFIRVSTCTSYMYEVHVHVCISYMYMWVIYVQTFFKTTSIILTGCLSYSFIINLFKVYVHTLNICLSQNLIELCIITILRVQSNSYVELDYPF